MRRPKLDFMGTAGQSFCFFFCCQKKKENEKICFLWSLGGEFFAYFLSVQKVRKKLWVRPGSIIASFAAAKKRTKDLFPAAKSKTYSLPLLREAVLIFSFNRQAKLTPQKRSAHIRLLCRRRLYIQIRPRKYLHTSRFPAGYPCAPETRWKNRLSPPLGTSAWTNRRYG